jgi:Spy/CpxP family protein refolding chaperone
VKQMSFLASIRALSTAVFLAGLAVSPICAQTHHQPAPVVRAAPPPPNGGFSRKHPGNPNANGEHLKEWMNQHSNLTPEQQQQQLEKEPGFHDLPPQTQQRMRDQLTHLNAMSPAQRQRILDRNEWMERLSVEQRGQVRAATKQLAVLPPDERRYVARTFRGLRQLPPQQRENVLNSDRFSHLTPEQRTTLNSLMKVEPLLPPAYDGGPPAQPQK